MKCSCWREIYREMEGEGYENCAHRADGIWVRVVVGREQNLVAASWGVVEQT